MERWLVSLCQILILSAAIAFWHLGSTSGFIDPFFFSSPEKIGAALIRLFRTDAVWFHMGVTFYETIVGFLLGGFLGILTGMLIGVSPVTMRILNPFILFFYSMPRIALAPIFIVILGLGVGSKIATVAFTIFFILLINTVAGIENIQPIWVQSARLMGATRFQIARKVILPGVLSWIFAGFRVALSLAFASAVIAEFTGATRGVGFQLMLSSSNFDTTGGFAWMIILGVMAVTLNIAMGKLEDHILAWRPTASKW